VPQTWPTPETAGLRTIDTFAPWISYHFPYTDREAAGLGMAVIDASCHVCERTTRINIPLAENPEDDEYPASGISAERSNFTMEHLHGRKTRG
jgi:hypothetical protein